MARNPERSSRKRKWTTLAFWKRLAVDLLALGTIVLLWMVLVQVLTVAIAVILGVVVAMFSGWGAGLVAGVLVYAIEMKLLWYMEIFDMITVGRSSKPAQVKRPSDQHPPG